jgi:SAM-dependent methyltransferase
LLEGYTNVDAPSNHSKIKPDVECDLRDLPFADDSADEILSVHVIEHFWRWEVRDVLYEWVRVLKPRGRMVIECPNLISACQEFLKDPNHHGDGPDGQKTMWVFYGDPKWKDPLMVHRWGYTPNTLGALMDECGLTDLVQEPAQFKLKEPRDMRIVGTKRGLIQLEI